MSDNYQAVYDAVRSRINHVDTHAVMEQVLRDAFGMTDHQIRCVAETFSGAAFEQQRPSVLFRPQISKDGNQWCALYGDDLQNGVAGFGDSPDLAMRDFDKNWSTK